MGICWWPGAGKDDFSIMPFELSVQLSHVFRWEGAILRGLGGTTDLVLELQLLHAKPTVPSSHSPLDTCSLSCFSLFFFFFSGPAVQCKDAELTGPYGAGETQGHFSLAMLSGFKSLS